MSLILPQRWNGSVANISLAAAAEGGDSFAAIPEKCIIAVQNTNVAAKNILWTVYLTVPSMSPPLITQKEYRAQVAVTGVFAIGDKVKADYGSIRNTISTQPMSVAGSTTVLIRPNLAWLDISSGLIKIDYETFGDMNVAVVALPVPATLFYHTRYQALLYPPT